MFAFAAVFLKIGLTTIEQTFTHASGANGLLKISGHNTVLDFNFNTILC